MKGHSLLDKVFTKTMEMYGELNLSEIEEISGVENYDDNIDYISGWYAFHTVSFDFDGKRYQFEYKEHTSDNVSDTHWYIDTFEEVPVGEEFTYETSTFLGDDLVDLVDWVQGIVSNGNRYDIEVKLTKQTVEEDEE